MKNFLTFLLAMSMLLSFAACAEKTQSDDSNETTAAQVQDTNNDSDSNSENDNDNGNDTDSENESENKAITFTEIVAIDNSECSIKITGIEPDNMWGYTLKAQLENKSSDKTYMFSVESAAINGVECNPLFAVEVAAGKKSNDEITFMDDALEKNGITEYTDIELTFRVYDSEDWSADDVATQTVHVYPYGEDNVTLFTRETLSTDNVIIDNDYITVIVTGYEEDDFWGYSANLFLVNKTDKTVMFCADDVSVNGFMANPLFATSVSAGKCAFSSITWSDTTFEENGITEVEEIEFSLRAYDYNDWFADDFTNETITLNP